MSNIDQGAQAGPTEDEKAAQADGRAAEQETADAVEESDENKPGDTIESNGGAVGASGGELRGQPSAGAVLDEKSFGGSNKVPPVTETDGDVDANADRMAADADEDFEAKEAAERAHDDDKNEVSSPEEAAILLGKFQALAKGEISREEARQWLEENYPE